MLDLCRRKSEEVTSLYSHPGAAAAILAKTRLTEHQCHGLQTTEVQRIVSPTSCCSGAVVAVHRYQKPDYQALRYHSAPKKKKTVGSLDEIDPEMRAAWDKLGIPIGEQVLVAALGVGCRGQGFDSPYTQHTGCVGCGLVSGSNLDKRRSLTFDPYVACRSA